MRYLRKNGSDDYERGLVELKTVKNLKITLSVRGNRQACGELWVKLWAFSVFGW